MNTIKVVFHNIKIKNRTIVFTWDDNLSRHFKYIAPEFKKRDLYCTFYINPGEDNFEEIFLNNYKQLFMAGFEIGSHGYTHKPFSTLTTKECLEQFDKSYYKIMEYFGKPPLTFAFPHHDYNNYMLLLAKQYYLETRNTLTENKFFSLKTKFSINDMIEIIDNHNYSQPLVFVGHSVYLKNEEIVDKKLKQELGYKPIKLDDLSMLLDYILRLPNIEILTFKQTVIKQYILKNCKYNENCFELRTDDKFFAKQGLNLKELRNLV